MIDRGRIEGGERGREGVREERWGREGMREGRGGGRE